MNRVLTKNVDDICNLTLTISANLGLVEQSLYYNNAVASKDLRNYYLLSKGDFAYNKSSSENYPYGTIKRLEAYEMGVLSSLYIVFNIKNFLIDDSDFWTVYFETTMWHEGVSKVAAEGARNHGLLNISAEDFFRIIVKSPTKSEQIKISDFILAYDQLITLQQRELLLCFKEVTICQIIHYQSCYSLTIMRNG